MNQPIGRTCVVCGAPAGPAFRAPQPEIAPDLDMRPGEPARSTLLDWIQECRRCGAAAPDLATLPSGAEVTVARDDYKALGGAGRDETTPFRRWALICERAGDEPQRAEALLQAAWAAEDAAAMTDAASLRTQVAALWAGTHDIELSLRRLDVLRRCGAFEEAEAWGLLLTQRTQEETAGLIIAFQRSRIAARDIGRHLISSAMPPPAHAPHVTHGKPASTGFWSRLLRK